MVEWQGTVEDIVIPEISNTMNRRSNINVSRVCDDCSFGQSSCSRSVDVEELIVMARSLDLVCRRWISGNLAHEQLKIFSVSHCWQVYFIVELEEFDFGAEL